MSDAQLAAIVVGALAGAPAGLWLAWCVEAAQDRRRRRRVNEILRIALEARARGEYFGWAEAERRWRRHDVEGKR